MAGKRKDKRELVPLQKVDDKYLNFLQNECLCNLGKAIHEFRSIGSMFVAGSVSPYIMTPIDAAYQAYLDRILDEILNCHDLKLDNAMINGLNKMMLTRRKLINEEID